MLASFCEMFASKKCPPERNTAVEANFSSGLLLVCRHEQTEGKNITLCDLSKHVQM